MTPESKPRIFAALSILHKALLGGLFLFTAFAFVLVYLKMFPAVADVELNRIFQVVAIALSVLVVFIGYRVFNKKLLTLRESGEPALEKLNQYRTAVIIWWAMIEGPGLFAVICLLITGNYAFVALAIVHIILLAVSAPKPGTITTVLNIGSDDLRQIGEVD
ncbi:MAG: hypothetical protein H7Y31_08690 [Chitinophagaceae bacterium]|nr:hypothetical protein [Chitinophagaceae bacterium]